MNEFQTALFAVIVAEAGATAAILYWASPLLRLGGFTELEAMVLPHAASFVRVLATAVGVTLFLIPELWRPRKSRSAKMTFLCWVFAVCLSLDLGILAYLYFEPVIMGDQPVQEPNWPTLWMVLLFRGTFWLVWFWATVLIHGTLCRRRIPPPAPPRKLVRRNRPTGEKSALTEPGFMLF